MSNKTDFIEIFPNALPASLCDRLVDALDNHPGVAAGHTGHGLDTTKKNSLDLVMDHHADLNELKQQLLSATFDHMMRYFDQYFLALVGAISVELPDQQGNPVTLTPDNYARLGSARIRDLVAYLFRSGTINLQKYIAGQGGYPHWHSEQFPQLPHNEPLHRVVLYMYYLNDVDQGGETEFYYQQRKIKPTKGTMVIAPAGFTHSHRGNVPVTQDKYIATSWILFNRAEKLYGAK